LLKVYESGNHTCEVVACRNDSCSHGFRKRATNVRVASISRDISSIFFSPRSTFRK